MNEAAAVIVGALVGAAAGVAGGGVAAIASLRASQLSARAPLGPILVEIKNTLIQMNVTRGTDEYWQHRKEFEKRWGEFSVQQRILCPSDRIANLMGLVRAIGGNSSDPPEALLNLAGQTMEKITQMVAAHGNFLFRFRARLEEARIIRRWLDSESSKLLSEEVRTQLRKIE
ncbi:MAG TPA: hypothetical protein VMT58_05465 [Candidatus Binataceae bacterium]|nr:hypothetical protein [Candidatus Binataceae bacterium]